jgi:xylose isomerase
MRTYLILKEKAEEFRADVEIQALLVEIHADDGSMDEDRGACAPEKAFALRAYAFDRVALRQRGMRYERLDQLVNELLLGGR